MTPRHYHHRGCVALTPPPLTDYWLLTAAVTLVLLGLLMVASSSISMATEIYGQPFYFLIRQSIFLAAAGILVLAVSRVPIKVWYRWSQPLLLVVLALLTIVLIPGIGKTVNGSTRWLNLPMIHVQVSEIAKLGVAVYFASYLVRYREAVQTQTLGFAKSLLVIAVVSGLLLLEPDFGSVAVIVMAMMAVLFLAGARLLPFMGLAACVVVALGGLIWMAPYRMARVLSFLDPWADQFGGGYQLTQSLIAFGRGGWLGVGLGESVQKLFYLPEAHTDFLFAVLAEELGLIGIIVTLALFMIIIVRGMWLGRRNLENEQYFAGYLAYACTLLIGIQALINMGVSMGVLPTKGLTLPLMSYGGSSLLINCMMIALLLRIDFEWRQFNLNHQWDKKHVKRKRR